MKNPARMDPVEYGQAIAVGIGGIGDGDGGYRSTFPGGHVTRKPVPQKPLCDMLIETSQVVVRSTKKAEINIGSDEELETLYYVFVVDKNRRILCKELVVAKDSTGAQFRADVSGVLRGNNLEPDDVTIIVYALGDVAVSKKPERVIVEREVVKDAREVVKDATE